MTSLSYRSSSVNIWKAAKSLVLSDVHDPDVAAVLNGAVRRFPSAVK